ncbi:ECF transporter S component [Enterococcus sp. 2201sp1_2201st1_B8_2201SCRN_220225]|uniref:ECF transporter S component n=1 Tax=unclassified Enterococcus TaxID=2608891 RepID=UPI0034A5208C
MSQKTKDFLNDFYQDHKFSASSPTFQEPAKRRSEESEIEEIWQTPVKQKKISRRTKVALFILFLLVPGVIFFGMKIGDRHYLVISLLLLVLAMLPFFMIFEDRKPQARELIVIAVLVAIAVASRGAFFMLPQFKPVAAIVIISGVAFGAEAGFLVGCLTALVSNIFFSQGPWTPWQMFAFGMIGFVAGLFYRLGWLKATRTSLCIFGFFSIFFIYGLIMNPASLLMFTSVINVQALIAVFISGAPMDLIHAISTVIFLGLLAKPFLEKLARIKKKYGLVE